MACNKLATKAFLSLTLKGQDVKFIDAYIIRY
jgi:hypothetical protein